MFCRLLKALASGSTSSICYLSTNSGFLYTGITRTSRIRVTSCNDTVQLEKISNRYFSVEVSGKDNEEKKDSPPLVGNSHQRRLARRKLERKAKKEAEKLERAKQRELELAKKRELKLAKQKELELAEQKEVGLDVEKNMISLCLSMPVAAAIHISKIHAGNGIKIGQGFAQRIFTMLTSAVGTEILKNS